MAALGRPELSREKKNGRLRAAILRIELFSP